MLPILLLTGNIVKMYVIKDVLRVLTEGGLI